MRTKSVITVLATCMATCLYAQKYHVKTEEDNPKNARNLNVSLLTGLNTTNRSFFGLTLQGNYSISRFSFEASLEPGIVLMKTFAPENTTTGYKPSTLFEAGGCFYYLDKIKNTSYRYVISSSTVGNTTYTKYVPIPVSKRVMYGVRGGLNRFSLSEEWTKNDPGFVSGQDYRNYGTSSTFFGLNFRKVRDFKVGLEEYTKLRSVRQVRDFYLDLVLSPGTSLFYNSNRTFETGTDVNKIGFRMGWNWRSNRVFGGNLKFEMGRMPGYKHQSAAFHMLMSYGICISQRVGKKGDKVHKD